MIIMIIMIIKNAITNCLYLRLNTRCKLVKNVKSYNNNQISVTAESL